jgi:cell shape-determining protein MreC
VFWVLLGACAVAIFLPGGLTRPLRGGFQLIAAPGQRMGNFLRLAAAEQAERLGDASRRLTVEQSRELRDELEAHKLLAARLRAQRDALAERLQQVTGLRNALWRGLPPDARQALLGQIVRTVPAGLYGRDLAALRDVAVLEAGADRNIKPGRWVTTLRFVDQGRFTKMKQDLPVLATDRLGGAMLVGRIDQVYFGQSRVRLITDVESRIHARIYHRLADGRYRPGPTCLVIGAGGGRMEIPRMAVDRKKPIQVGDLVMTRSGEPMLPPAVPIGTVCSARPQQDNPLLYEIEVRPHADLSRVNRVLIVEMGPAPGRTRPG